MMAFLWSDIGRDIASAQLHFGKALDIFHGARWVADEEPDYLASMAFMHAMQAGYTSFESAMKRLLAMLEEPLPSGAEWHKDLVRRLGSEVPGSRPPCRRAGSAASLGPAA